MLRRAIVKDRAEKLAMESVRLLIRSNDDDLALANVHLTEIESLVWELREEIEKVK